MSTKSPILPDSIPPNTSDQPMKNSPPDFTSDPLASNEDAPLASEKSMPLAFAIDPIVVNAEFIDVEAVPIDIGHIDDLTERI